MFRHQVFRLTLDWRGSDRSILRRKVTRAGRRRASDEEVLDNPRMFNHYPQVITRIFEKLFWIGEQPKAKLSSTVIREALGGFGNLDAIKDALSLRRV